MWKITWMMMLLETLVTPKEEEYNRIGIANDFSSDKIHKPITDLHSLLYFTEKRIKNI